jgi:WD40 repeat protein
LALYYQAVFGLIIQLFTQKPEKLTMLKNFLVLSTFFTLLFSVAFSQTPENQIAVVKQSLPEFRDVSVWKGRTGLVRFSPEGKYLAVSGKSADIVIYETETGKVVSQIDGRGFTAFSFSPDSKFAAAQTAFNSSLQIFEVDTGKKIRDLTGLDKVNNLQKIMGGSGFVNTINGQVLLTPAAMSEAPVSPDWKHLLINKNDKEYKLFDFATGDFKFDFNHENYSTGKETAKTILFMMANAGSFLGSISSSEFSSDSKYVAITNGNKKPTIWSTETGKLVASVESENKVYNAIFSRDGKMLAISDTKGITRVVETASGKEISTFGSKNDKAFAALWSKNGERIITVRNDKHNDVSVYEAKSGKKLFSLENSDVGGVFESNTGKYIATVPRNNKLLFYQIWDAETGKLMGTSPKTKDKKSLTMLKWSPNDEMVITASGLKGDVEVWYLNGGQVQSLKNATFPIEFSFDGKYMATGGKTDDPKNDVGYIWEFKTWSNL